MLRDQIVNATDARTALVIVPEWGDAKIEVRAFTIAEQVAFYKTVSLTDRKGQFVGIDRQKWAVQLILLSAYDPDTGKRLFEAADADMLAKKSAVAIGRVFDVAAKLSGLRDDDVEEQEQALKGTASDDSN